MPDLLIRIKKNKDGSASLSCVRHDGTTTWQRQDGKLGAFFPQHDLTHYAVESTLGYSNAFYGLIADGWDLADFAAPARERRGPIPREAGEGEVFVGVLDLERRLLQRFSAAEFNEQARFAADRQGSKGFIPRELTEDEIARVRATRADVFTRWAAVEPGAALELDFERGVLAGD